MPWFDLECPAIPRETAELARSRNGGPTTADAKWNTMKQLENLHHPRPLHAVEPGDDEPPSQGTNVRNLLLIQH